MRRLVVLVNALFISFSLLLFNIPASAMEYQQPLMREASPPSQVNVLVNGNFIKTEISNYSIMKEVNLGNQIMLTIKVPDSQNINTVIEEIKRKSGVIYVEQDQQIKKEFVANDPYIPEQWFLSKIGAPAAWDQTKGSENINVAVIDGKVDITHPELINRIVDPYDIVNHSASFNTYDDHATHVAGIIAAEMDNGAGGAGIAPHVKIIPINVFHGDSADVSDAIAGVSYAVNHHAKIINMSMGVYHYSYLMDSAIQDAYQHGILIVAAAGNDSTSLKSYPASYNHVISVSSVDENSKISPFSNFGSTIDIAAPGENILSTLPGNSYGYMSGTSMASPMVSGVAALVLSKNPNLTPDQVEGILNNTADDLGAPGKDPLYGYGLVDASKALANTPAMISGWKQVNNKRYYYDNGIMKTGWLNSNSKWYFFNNKGEMQTGWLKWGNKWYYLDQQTGAMKTGWILSGGSWYFLGANGAMATGWLSWNGDWYYLNNSGKMVTGWLNWNGKWYYLKSNGAMAKNTIIQGYKIGKNGAWIH